MKLAYYMKFNHNSDGSYWVEGLPPLSHVVTQGDNLESAKLMAREALTGVLETMLDHNMKIPRPISAKKTKNIHLISPEPEIVFPILLRWARENEQLTLEELANRMGVTYQAVQKLERSGSNPSIKTMSKVAKALNKELKFSL